jgi:uridine kinase
MLNRPILVALAGPTCSGKTSLALALAETLPGGPHSVLATDAYYRDLSEMPLEERAAANFDAPEALDWPLLRTHVQKLAEGEAVDVPVYDFATHARTHDTITLSPTPFVILEGLYALYDAAIRACCTLGIYVGAPEETCLTRRIARDIAERGRTEQSVRDQFAVTVSPMYRRYIAPTRQYADLVLDGLLPAGISAQAVAGWLNKKQGQQSG